MSNKVAQFAKLTADRARRRWAEQQIKRRKAIAEKLDSAGTYISYVADSERHKIRLLSGKIVLAESLTNAGLDEGDRVAVSYGGGWRFKAMPR